MIRSLQAAMIVALLALPHCSAHTTNLTSEAGESRLPRILIVFSTYPPAMSGPRQVILDLFEYGIVANVTGTHIYVNMDRSEYDIIIFAGFSNPVDPGQIVARALEDVSHGKKLVFLGSTIFEETDASGRVLKSQFALKRLLGMPAEVEKYNKTTTLSLYSSEDFAKEGQNLTIGAISYFENKTSDTIAFMSTPDHRHYCLLINSRGAWVAPEIANYLHFGKVIARLWFGGSSSRFGFSLDRVAGLPIVVWRVDADYSNSSEALQWIDGLARQHNLKVTIGARGGRINIVTAIYWRNLAKNPLVEIAVHSYYHRSYRTDILQEVLGTYETLIAYDIPAKQVFQGWGYAPGLQPGNSWNYTQIQALYAHGWRMIHSPAGGNRVGLAAGNSDDYEGLGLGDFASACVIGNFTSGPPIVGHAGTSDFDAWHDNRNFTAVNTMSFKENTDRMLPFIFETHDYSYKESTFKNTYGTVKNQVQIFLGWLAGKNVTSIWLSDYLQLYFDANEGVITQVGSQFVVKRHGFVNEVKVYVGSDPVYASGPSVVFQRNVNGWLYVSLKSEPISTFNLEPRGELLSEILRLQVLIHDDLLLLGKQEPQSNETQRALENATKLYERAVKDLQEGEYQHALADLQNARDWISRSTQAPVQTTTTGSVQDRSFEGLLQRGAIAMCAAVLIAVVLMVTRRFRRKSIDENDR